MTQTMDPTALRATTIFRRLQFTRRIGEAIFLTLLLVILGDQMIFARSGGINGLTFYGALALGIGIICRQQLGSRSVMVAAAVFVVSVLPILEANTVFSLLCGFVGVSILALALWRRLPRSLTDLPKTLLRFYLLLPARFVSDALSTIFTSSPFGSYQTLVRAVLVWIVPLVFAGIFLLLFSAANPVIDDVLGRIDLDEILRLLDPGRMMLWFLLAVLVWPFLQLRLPRRRRNKHVTPPIPAEAALPLRENLLFGEAAILRSLIVFNLMFAVQTALDLTYLWGGVSLPDGLSYASYAHRGAYPLIVTALLAAAFVLAAMRRGGAAEHSRTIRTLVFAFLAQNVLLVASSILRLDLYVEIYSLTELRLAAGIWMALVAIGLLLIIARIALRKSNSWLVATNLLALMLTFYAVSWIDLSGLIARYNVEQSAQLGGEGEPLDFGYMYSLGPTAIPALDLFIERVGDADQRDTAQAVRKELAYSFSLRDRDWRAFNLRDDRLARYLGDEPVLAMPTDTRQW